MSTVMWIPFPKLRKAMRREKTTWNCENSDSGIIDKNHCQKITKMILRAKIGLTFHFCVIFILLSPFNLTSFFILLNLVSFPLSFVFIILLYSLFFSVSCLIVSPSHFFYSAPYFRLSFSIDCFTQ